ncbi:MAG: SDR family NAD(P)-dependent oxidoreductase [Caulobacteraceae bacterium]|nr:SDR family NAD(P)-dependent oxidoreductase [Caulobacteraceae bacterium]
MARRKPGEGQTALITGASAGIGVDLAECFAKDGYDLILTARSEGALQKVANRLSAAHGVKAHTVAQDLGAFGGGSAVAAAIAAKGLNVDVVVNNAGYGHAGALTSSDLPTQLGMIDLNVRALVELTYHLLGSHARQQTWGRYQRRVDSGVSAWAADGELLRLESLRALVLRSDVGRSARHRRACELPLPWSNRFEIS